MDSLSAILVAVSLLLTLVLAGCLGDAERTNPLDPLSDEFREEGAVRGVVTTLAPFEGVPTARVHLIPLDTTLGPERVKGTDPAGRFLFEEVPTGRYALRAEADGYASADTTLDVPLGRPTGDIAFRLDRLPRVEAQTVRTERINSFIPDPFARLFVEAVVSDPDGDLDLATVALVIPYLIGDTLAFRDTLDAVLGADEPTYEGSLLEADLPVSLQDLLGRNLYVEVTDRAGETVRGRDAHVVRLVERYPQPLDPVGQAPPVGPTPTLTWAPLDLPYTFEWRVAVTNVDVPGEPVVTFNGLSSSQTSVSVEEPLDPSTYSWTVAAVDAFGNLARSTPAFFTVVP